MVWLFAIGGMLNKTITTTDEHKNPSSFKTPFLLRLSFHNFCQGLDREVLRYTSAKKVSCHGQNNHFLLPPSPSSSPLSLSLSFWHPSPPSVNLSLHLLPFHSIYFAPASHPPSLFLFFPIYTLSLSLFLSLPLCLIFSALSISLSLFHSLSLPPLLKSSPPFSLITHLL